MCAIVAPGGAPRANLRGKRLRGKKPKILPFSRLDVRRQAQSRAYNMANPVKEPEFICEISDYKELMRL